MSLAPAPPSARLTQFNMLKFELEDLQRSILEGEAMMNLLIDEVVRKYAEALRRATDDSSAHSSVTSCESGLRDGTEHRFSVSAGASARCERNLSQATPSGDFYSRRGVDHNSETPRISYRTTAKEGRKTRRRNKRGKAYAKNSQNASS